MAFTFYLQLGQKKKNSHNKYSAINGNDIRKRTEVGKTQFQGTGSATNSEK